MLCIDGIDVCTRRSCVPLQMQSKCTINALVSNIKVEMFVLLARSRPSYSLSSFLGKFRVSQQISYHVYHRMTLIGTSFILIEIPIINDIKCIRDTRREILVQNDCGKSERERKKKTFGWCHKTYGRNINVVHIVMYRFLLLLFVFQCVLCTKAPAKDEN